MPLSRPVTLVFALLAAMPAVAGSEPCPDTAAAGGPWAIDWRAVTPVPPGEITSARPWRVDFLARSSGEETGPESESPVCLRVGPAPGGAQQATAPRPVAFEYSDGYRVRRRIHFYAPIRGPDPRIGHLSPRP